jgi:hypothetical protein
MDNMGIKIMFAGAIFLGGWLWSYVFIRQILFNFITAFPLIKKMRSLRDDLIAIGADRYTTISSIVCFIFAAILLFVVIRFCPLYLTLCFAGGAIIAFIMLLKMVSPRNRAMFDTFCSAYCRFVPDDELRTAMYNKKTGLIRARLKAMEVTDTFVPDFQK